MYAIGIQPYFLTVVLATASLLIIDFASAKWLQTSDLPEIVVTERPPAMIDVSRSDFSLSGYISEPFTVEVQVQDSAGVAVLDDYFGPNTHFEANLTFTNGRGDLLTNATVSLATIDGVARFAPVVLLVEPDVYDLEVTVFIIFAIEGLGETSLTLGSVSVGSLMVGVEPTATPLPTSTINPFEGTPSVLLTLQYFATNNAPAQLTMNANLQAIATVLAETPQPTQYCPPNDPFGCNFPTSTPSPTSTPTPMPSVTPPPIVVPADGNFTVNVPSRGTIFRNEVSGPSGDTSDIIDLQFDFREITQPTVFSIGLACPENTSVAAAIVVTGDTIACGQGRSITASSSALIFRVIVTSLATREQIRTPYVLTIAPSR
jgi:hypothetical protein